MRNSLTGELIVYKSVVYFEIVHFNSNNIGKCGKTGKRKLP